MSEPKPTPPKQRTAAELRNTLRPYGDHALQATDPKTTPEEFVRILDEMGEATHLYHVRFSRCVNVQQAREALDKYRRLHKLFETPHLPPEQLPRVTKSLGAALGYWYINIAAVFQFGFPAGLPIPVRLFTNKKLGEELLTGFDAELARFFSSSASSIEAISVPFHAEFSNAAHELRTAVEQADGS